MIFFNAGHSINSEKKIRSWEAASLSDGEETYDLSIFWTRSPSLQSRILYL